MQNDNKTDIQSVTSYKMLIYLVFKENDTERSVTVEQKRKTRCRYYRG